MSAKKKSTLIYIACFLPLTGMAASLPFFTHTNTLAEQLGWVAARDNVCGGYFITEPMQSTTEGDAVNIASKHGLFSLHNTSTLEGPVTITRNGEELTANKAILYRDPVTFKLNTIDMLGNVNFKQANTLLIGKQGRYNFITKTKSLIDLLYRTPLNIRETPLSTAPLTAWGRAYQFSQTAPRIYELTDNSFSTCSPVNPTWQLKTSHLVLNKNTGRGYATHARLFVHGIPVFYFPYFNFSIDKQRKSGFLWPTVSGKWGPSIFTPFYWNMAPNYDMTITPGIMSKRGFQLSDEFRYLTSTSTGKIDVSALPSDRYFSNFQKKAQTNLDYTNPQSTPQNPASVTTAELRRLEDSSTTRKAFSWRDDSRFNEHWSNHLDFNYAGDDYYMSDFGSNLNAITQNQLLQEEDVYYKGKNWNFTGRMQAYQTLHPIDQNAVQNQYRRFPELILNGDYPDQPYGLEYFINNDVTHFDLLKTPGTDISLPVGNRIHTQPGVSLPFYRPSFYVTPRLQLALTDYNLTQTKDTNAPTAIHRAVPIADLASGLFFTRNLHVFGTSFTQTLEPQIYYTYIPYRHQSDIPIFDTTVNNLTYDQLFNYNRFTSIDRIGDANQISAGVSSRFIDQETGFEKVRLGVGEIIYFSNRHVTLCNSESVCSDNPFDHSNHQRLSPISGLLSYHVNQAWSTNANVLWDPISKQLTSTTLAFQYRPDERRLLNLGYSYARNDILTGVTSSSPINNLKVTDFSFAWPLAYNISAVGRWSQSWNDRHLQNLLYGLQYDTCCWAVQAVGGKAFVGADPNQNNALKYNSEFYIQFALKGLGDVGSGSPTGLLSTIPGYKAQDI